jgi:hypothetical protein
MTLDGLLFSGAQPVLPACTDHGECLPNCRMSLETRLSSIAGAWGFSSFEWGVATPFPGRDGCDAGTGGDVREPRHPLPEPW